MTSYLHWPLSQAPEWRAEWIAPASVENQRNVYFRVRHHWMLEQTPESCLLHVAAETRYRIYVNGTEAGLGPVRGTRNVNYFDSYQIASLLKPGENWLAVAVHSPNMVTFKASPAQPAVRVQLDDGRMVASDASWQTQIASDWRSDVPLYTFQIGYMEWQDLAAEQLNWQIGRDRGIWNAAAVVGQSEKLLHKSLHPRDIPALRENRYLPTDIPMIAAVPAVADPHDTQIGKLLNTEPHLPLLDPPNLTALLRAACAPVQIKPRPDGGGVVFVADFGREINGGLEVMVEGPTGTVVDIGYNEELTNNRLPTLLGEYSFADRYILRAGRQMIGNVFSERGFRMVQIAVRNPAGPVFLHALHAVDCTYPFTRRGTFACSDALLNDIWATCTRTLSACATDTFVDCPWRENAFYVNDLLVENVTSLQAFGDPRLNARCLRLAETQIRPDGLIPAAVPYGIVPGRTAEESADHMTLLAANLFRPQMLEEYLLYSGDAELVRELARSLPTLLDTLASWEDSTGLVHPPARFWNFIDWSFELSGAPLDGRNTATFNWLYVLMLDTAARLFKRIGDPRDTSSWTERAARTAATTDQHFWSDPRQCYVEWIDQDGPSQTASQLSHAVALLTGRVPEARRVAVRKCVSRKDLLAPELYLHHYILRALTRTCRGREALSLIRELWGPIVLSGSPTIWECGVHGHGKSAWSGAGSNCHGFSSTPIDFLQGVILGVRPTEPAFTTCTLEPYAWSLVHATGTVPTPHGNIHVAWKKNETSLAIDVVIPFGVTAILKDGRQLAAGSHHVEVAN